MIRSVFIKLYLQLTILFFCTFLVLLIVLGILLQEREMEEFQQAANAEAESIIFRLRGQDVKQWPQLLESYRMVLPLEILSYHQELDDKWEPVSDTPELYFNDYDSDFWKIARRIDGSSYYLELSELEDDSDFIDVLEPFTPIILLFLVFALGFYKLARQIERPVKEFSSGTVALAEGIFSTRLKEEKFDEPFLTLSRRFNFMAEKIEQLIRDQQIMVGAVPHELRTPLARVRFALDLTRSVDSLPELKQRIETIDRYVDMLESIVSDTLALNRLQLDDKVDGQSFILSELVHEAVDEQLSETTADIDVIVDSVLEGKNVFGEKPLIKRAVANLLANAKRYAASCVEIDLKLSTDGNVTIAVHDDGPGVPLDKQPLLFIPFSRVDDGSRSRATGGVGLGLALVDLIMRKHGGTVSYQASKLGGASFLVEWPAVHIDSTLIENQSN